MLPAQAGSDCYRNCYNGTVVADPDLAAVVEAWPHLPEAIKARHLGDGQGFEATRCAVSDYLDTLSIHRPRHPGVCTHAIIARLDKLRQPW